MKFILALLAVLAVAGLGQARKVPDFGKGPLHEDMQDILDLMPMEEIAEVFLDYLAEDEEVKAAARYLADSTLLKDLTIEVQAVPEVINLFNYLHKKDIEIYYIVNAINKVFNNKILEPPTTYSAIMKRTGGIAGFFKDVMSRIRYNDFIRIYVNKMQTSPAFVDFIKQLKSDNFQQIVNKIYRGKSFQILLNGLKKNGVNVRIVGDLLYIVLGITVPKDTFSMAPSVIDELMDFVKLIPAEKVNSIVTEYVTKDQKVQKAILFLLKPEFHSLLRNVEALKEHQKLVIFLYKAGLTNVIDSINEFHKAIGMEDYVPPKIETVFGSEIGMQKVGDGFEAMLDDILTVIPVDKIQALYDEKIKSSKVFADFVAKMTSSEFRQIIKAMSSHKSFQELVTKSKNEGLDLVALRKFYRKILPIPIPDFIFAAY